MRSGEPGEGLLANAQMPLTRLAFAALRRVDLSPQMRGEVKFESPAIRPPAAFDECAALPPLPMIDRVRAHICRAGDAVRHVEETRHRRNVEDIAIGKA